MKVFLGGTCGDSTWRDELIPRLTIESYNPVVPNWTPECAAEEIRQRENCDICLYVITPDAPSVYSIAEIADDSNKRPHKTVVFIYDPHGVYSPKEFKHLSKVMELAQRNGALYPSTWEELIRTLNSWKFRNIRSPYSVCRSIANWTDEECSWSDRGIAARCLAIAALPQN